MSQPPRPLLLKNARLPEDTRRLYESYKLVELNCKIVASDYFRENCLPAVFRVLQEEKVITSGGQLDYAVALVENEIDMDRLEELDDDCGDENAMCVWNLVYFIGLGLEEDWKYEHNK